MVQSQGVQLCEAEEVAQQSILKASVRLRNKKINEEQGNSIHVSIDGGAVAIGRCDRGNTHLPIFGKNLQKY